jgi:hypothetical protein
MDASTVARPHLRHRDGVQAFTFLLLPSLWASRNRARRREKGDGVRALLFGLVGLGVMGALFYGAFWLTWQAAQYSELVAVPDVPLVPGVQRCRGLTVDVLPVR